MVVLPGRLPPGERLTERLIALLNRFGLPTRTQGLESNALIEAMSRDKKNQKGKTRFVLPRGLGCVELTDLPSEDDVRGVLARL